MTDTIHDVGRGTTVSRPNVLFIMADDHAANAISAYGFADLISRLRELQVEFGDVEDGATASMTARGDGR